MISREERKKKKVIKKYEKTTELPADKKREKLMKFSEEELKTIEEFLKGQLIIVQEEILSHAKMIEKIKNNNDMIAHGKMVSLVFAEDKLSACIKLQSEICQELRIINEIKRFNKRDPQQVEII